MGLRFVSTERLVWQFPGQRPDGTFNTTALEKELRERIDKDPRFEKAGSLLGAPLGQTPEHLSTPSSLLSSSLARKFPCGLPESGTW